MSAAQWGNIPQWVSGIGTTLAFSATFYVIRRDAKLRRLSQAAKVFYLISEVRDEENKLKHYVYTITNGSNEPIYDVSIHMAELQDFLAYASRVLGPGLTVEYLSSHNRLAIVFRDNGNKEWSRDWRGHVRVYRMFGRFPRLRRLPRKLNVIRTIQRRRRAKQLLLRRRARAEARRVAQSALSSSPEQGSDLEAGH